MDAMFDAVLGYRVRRATYLKRADVTDQTATRDLAALTSEGVLTAHGNGRGRYYTAGEPLRQIQGRRRARRAPLHDPYPWMRAKLSERAPETAQPSLPRRVRPRSLIRTIYVKSVACAGRRQFDGHRAESINGATDQPGPARQREPGASGLTSR
jgi:hypothetical protein